MRNLLLLNLDLKPSPVAGVGNWAEWGWGFTAFLHVRSSQQAPEQIIESFISF